MPTKKVTRTKKTVKENLVEKKLTEMVDDNAAKTEKVSTQKSKKQFPWWGLISLVLILVFASILLYEYNKDFRNNVVNLANSTGVIKMNKVDSGNSKPVEKSPINLTIVYNKDDANQKAAIDQYVKNIETNLPNTKANATLVDKNEQQAKDIIAKLGAKYIPIFTTDESIKKHPLYPQFSEAILEKDGLMAFVAEGMEYLELPPIGDARTVGNPNNAKVTIMEYVSLSCHYCNEMQPIIAKVLDKYPNDVAWIYKNYDRGGIDQVLNGAVECAADQGRVEQMVNAMFSQQTDIFAAAQGASAEQGIYDQISIAAKAAGANPAKVLACTKEGTYNEKIQKQTAEGQEYGVMGTPGFFINGKFLGGAVSEADFMKIIDDELNKKK
ncbi:thioredoxin domain-containing protein [Candidatus Peregrinibacteria bacterium]|nr:thioredoxin domain-containing protein [Candidatus Peregrinibacteria bacterium]